MKFGKEFTSQMVPEWEEAYMNYNYLKTIIRHIKQATNPPAVTVSASLKRRLTLYRAFSGLTQRFSHSPTEDLENQAILIHSEDGDRYETMFLNAAEGGGEKELMYFRKLDEEFNKVVKFYKGKVGEVLKEADVLNKQMDAFMAFRIKVHHPQAGFDSVVEMNRLASDVSVSMAALAAATPSTIRASRRVAMDIIEEDHSKHYNESGDKDLKEVKPINQNNIVKKHKSKSSRSARPAPLEILDRITMNHTVETPRSSIKGLLNIVPDQAELKFSTENLKKVEEQLKRAFIEFYHKLRLLKGYSFLNITAFSKIMKKYDKISSRSCSKSYMKMVDNSYLGSCDDVHKLMERVEDSFIKHFSNSNRSKGIRTLRPKAKRERHRSTFSLGFFAGSTVALILALILIIRARDNSDKKGTHQYMETMFPLYSFFGFIVLHIIMYATNVYFWRRYRVNYPFIFGFKHGTELGYRQVLLVGFGLAMLALASVLANLDMEMDPRTGDYTAITELLPLGLVVLVIVVLFCPFNIIYRSSRFFLLKCAFHGVCAPFYTVSLPDFFLVDQLTSQVQAFRSLEFYICYYGWGDYKHRQNSCSQSAVFNTFHFIVAAIPFWSRLLQCLRRFYEEKDGMQGLNSIKYFSIIVAVTTRTAFSLNGGLQWKIIAWISSGIAVIFSTYWDLVLDWGLLQRNSKNRWLREKLLIPHKSVYFVAMVVNVLLRFAWLQTVLNIQVSFLYRENLIALVASLEIIRRGIWNFFRLENEHLNNVGKYRAFKSVPLPFNYDEDEVEDD